MKSYLKTKSFTLIELLVMVSICGIILGLLLAGVMFVQEQAKQADCVNNLKQVGLSLQLYFNEKNSYPDGLGDLSREGFLDDESMLACPSTGYTYETAYVMRNINSETGSFAIGCPSHSGEGRSVNLFLDGSVKRFKMAFGAYGADTLAPGGDLPLGQQVKFPDNSSATLTEGSAYFVQSFEIGDGKLYTLIAVPEDAAQTTIDVNVNTGSKFEVITPAAIAGVMGTEFTVVTGGSASEHPTTRITVTEGTVFAEERTGNEATLISYGVNNSAEIIGEDTLPPPVDDTFTGLDRLKAYIIAKADAANKNPGKWALKHLGKKKFLKEREGGKWKWKKMELPDRDDRKEFRKWIKDQLEEEDEEGGETDTDNDGTPDTDDDFPENPEESRDSDGDGVGDNADAFPNDPNYNIAEPPPPPFS